MKTVDEEERDIRSYIDRLIEVGPRVVICEQEVELGFRIVDLGSVPWFPKQDWQSGIVSMRGETVRIVAVLAKEPGNGAFGRMITGIGKAGLYPFVVVPLPALERILKRWGWRSTILGVGWQRQEVWGPPPGWMETRLAKSTVLANGH